MAAHQVGHRGDFAEESLTPLRVDGREIVVVHHQGVLYAVPDLCTHARKPLHDGSLEDGKLICCYHGARFDLESGRGTLPAIKPLERYPVRLEGDAVWVELN